MKTFAQFFLLALLAIGGYSFAIAQANPQITFHGDELCLLNNGPNDNCEYIQDQLIVFSFTNEGFTLQSFPFPFPIDLNTVREHEYIDVHDDPMVDIGINESFLEFSFVESGSIPFNMNELEQIALFVKNGRTALISRPFQSIPIKHHLLQNNPCQSLGVYQNSQGEIIGKNGSGVGTVLVLSEIIDPTAFFPMVGLTPGSKVGYGNILGGLNLADFSHEAGIPFAYPQHVSAQNEFHPTCYPENYMATSECCVATVSAQARIEIWAQFVVVRDLNSFGFYDPAKLFWIGGPDDKVYMYLDPLLNQIVVWKYGKCFPS